MTKPEPAIAARAMPCCCGPARPRGETAQEILDRRYASGEISKEQYEQMKQDMRPDRRDA